MAFLPYGEGKLLIWMLRLTAKHNLRLYPLMQRQFFQNTQPSEANDFAIQMKRKQEFLNGG